LGQNKSGAKYQKKARLSSGKNDIFVIFAPNKVMGTVIVLMTWAKKQ